jgi:prefoldin subunit 5
MAKKKTTVEELTGILKTTPKTYTLTEEQMQQLRDFATDLMDIRRNLHILEDEENLSKIMFHIGAMYNVADKAETAFDSFLEQFEEECDECGDNF